MTDIAFAINLAGTFMVGLVLEFLAGIAICTWRT